MKKESIQIDVFCKFHNIEIDLINSLIEKGLIEVVTEKENVYIPFSNLEKVERCIRLKNELGVNFAGIEVINNMRSRMIELRKELAYLKDVERQIMGYNFDADEDVMDY
jgi:hypothetical protein